MSEVQPAFLFGDRNVAFAGQHEVHITVPVETTDFEHFRTICKELGVKALFIQNEMPDGLTIPDYLTSSHYMCSSTEAFDKLQRISNSLLNVDIDVVREKIETVPWHPQAPSSSTVAPILEDTYFECHFGLYTNGQTPNLALIESYFGKLYVSRNKNRSKETGKVFATYRRYDYNSEDFISDVKSIGALLIEQDFTMDKPEIEYALYDSNIAHDSEWFNSYVASTP